MSIATRPTTAIQAEPRVQAPTHGRNWYWTVCGLAGSIVLAVAAFLPLWRLTLTAPQYPEGLQLTAYGSKMEGDLEEINELNHYIGVRAIEPDTVTELKLFPFVMAALVLAVAAGAVLLKDWKPRAILSAAVWAIPLGMLVDLQWWLYSYGHELDKSAPIRTDPFTPHVIGATRVLNFNSDAGVATGFWLMVAAALLISVAPFVAKFLWESWNNTGDAQAEATA